MEHREALVIGINKYPFLKQRKYGDLDLNAPAKDAEAIATLMETYGNFRVQRLPEVYEETQRNIVSPNLTADVTTIQQAIANLFNPPDHPPDIALLFFAGHGYLKETGGIREGYLVTSDASNDPRINNYGLSLKWLQELLQKSPVRQQIVWLDCCFSGELLNFAEVDPGYQQNARCLITASRSYEFSREQISGEHGIFTQVLLDGLNPENYVDGWVTNYNLANYINKQMSQTSQRPVFHNSGKAIILTTNRPEKPIDEDLRGICPYRSLAYFKQEDAQFFFGRTALTDELIERVRTDKFIAVLGASGSGKSSVLRAGLLYQLKQGQKLSGSDRWTYIEPFTPEENPLQKLECALKQTIKCDDEKIQIENEETPKILIIIDQFEECFTMCTDQQKRQEFFKKLLQIPSEKICLIIGMRADFLGRSVEYPDLAKQINQQLITVTPMTTSEIEEAIIKPAELVGLQVEKALITKMVDDVSEYPGSLPLLQYTLTELWNEAQNGNRKNALLLETYQQLGGVSGTLEKRANQVYEKFAEEQKPVVQRIFLELTQIGETNDTRRRVKLKELENPQHSLKTLQEISEKLVTARLININEEGLIDIIHEALIRHWGLLKEWIKTNQIAIEIERKIETDAEQWAKQGKPEDLGLLLQGVRLNEAENYLQEYGKLGMLDGLGLELIQVSQKVQARLQREQEEQQQLLAAHQEAQRILERANNQANRRIKFGLIVLIISSLLASIAILYANYSKKQLEQARKEQAEVREITQLEQEAIQSVRLFQAQPLKALLNSIKIAKDLQKKVGNHTLDQYPTVQPQIALHLILHQIRDRNILIGHQGDVVSAVFSHDGRKIVTASTDKTAKIWNIQGQEISTLKHQEGVLSAVFSPNGKLIVTTSYDHTAKIWDSTGQEISTLTHGSWVNQAVFSPNGKLIVTASDDHTAKIWDLKGQLIATLRGHKDKIMRVKFSADGSKIVTSSADHTAKIWNIQGQEIKTLRHQGAVFSVNFSPDGSKIGTTSVDRTAKIWNIQGQEIAVLEHRGIVNSIFFSPDGSKVVTASDDKTAKIWDNQGNLLSVLTGHQDRIYKAIFSPDGKLIVTISEDKTAKIWDSNGNLITTLKHEDGVLNVAFSEDGNWIITSSRDQTAKIWQTQGREINTLEHSDNIYRGVFSPDGNLIVTASDDQTAKIWDSKGNLISTLRGHNAPVNSAAFSPDGTKIVTASFDYKGKIWDHKGNLIATLIGHNAPVNNAVFSPDGTKIVTASRDRTAKIWDLKGKEIAELKGHEGKVYSAVFSPDGTKIVTASWDGTAKIWDLQGKLLHTLTGHQDGIYRAVFSPDGTKIVTASYDKTAKIWSVEGKLLKTLTGHQRWVWRAEFSPDGTKIVTASSDGTAKIWNLQGKLITTLTGHQGDVNSAVFSPDSKLVVTTSRDETAKIWSIKGKMLGTLGGHQGEVYSAVFNHDGSKILTVSLDHTAKIWDVENLDQLIIKGCDWVKDYLTYNPNAIEKEKALCGIKNQK